MNAKAITIKLGFIEGAQGEANVLRILSKPRSYDNGLPVPILFSWCFGGDMEWEDEQILTTLQTHTGISYLEIICESYSLDYLAKLRNTLVVCKVPHIKLELALHPENSEEQAEELISTVEAVLKNPHTTKLDLSCNRLGLLPENLFLRFCTAIRNSHLQDLDLGDNLLGEREDYNNLPLAEALADINELQALDLGFNQALSFDFLLILINQSQTAYLGLMRICSFFGEYPEDLLKVLTIIRERHKIKTLDLRSTMHWLEEYRPIYLADLINFIKHYNSLEKIVLSKNSLSKEEKAQLKQAAEQRQTALGLTFEVLETYNIEPKLQAQSSEALLASPQHSDASTISTDSVHALSNASSSSSQATADYSVLLSDASLFSKKTKPTSPTFSEDEQQHNISVSHPAPS